MPFHKMKYKYKMNTNKNFFNNNFFKEYIYDLNESQCTLKYLVKYHLVKAFKLCLNKITLTLKDNNQIFSILLKIKMSDGSKTPKSPYQDLPGESSNPFE